MKSWPFRDLKDNAAMDAVESRAFRARWSLDRINEEDTLEALKGGPTCWVPRS